MRLFVALVPPDRATADLSDYVAPRRAARSDIRWTSPHQWHLTLAFMAQVEEWQLDELEERLEVAARRRAPLGLAIEGAGAFPSVERAKVLFADVSCDTAQDRVELDRLAVGARNAAAKAGCAVDGRAFTPHVTLGRLARPTNVTHVLGALAPYAGPRWIADEIALISSELGGATPRYEVLRTFSLGSADSTG